MPLPAGTRYRVTTKGGEKIRLAFAKGGNRVIEAKNLHSGATHTPKEFQRDRLKKRMLKHGDAL